MSVHPMPLTIASELVGGRIPGHWLAHAVIHRDRPTGLFLTHGPEIHCWRSPASQGLWLTRHDISAITSPLLATYGRVVTKVRIGNTTGHRFVTRIGFTATGSDGLNILYEMTRPRHARY